MKTRVFFALLCLQINVVALYCQQRLNWDIYAGPSYSTIASSARFYGENQPDIAADINRKSGFIAGVDVKKPLCKKCSVLSGIQYTEKGNRFITEIGANREEIFQYLHYLSLPCLFDYEVWSFCSLQAGVEGSWLMQRRVRAVNPDLDPAQVPNPATSAFDLGLTAGVELRLGKSFYFRARYVLGTHSLREVALPDLNGSGAGKVNQYNRNTQLSMGYRF